MVKIGSSLRDGSTSSESQEGTLAYLSLVRSVGGREIGQPASVRLGAA
jgi:hypothetical protein